MAGQHTYDQMKNLADEARDEYESTLAELRKAQSLIRTIGLDPDEVYVLSDLIPIFELVKILRPKPAPRSTEE